MKVVSFLALCMAVVGLVELCQQPKYSQNSQHFHEELSKFSQGGRKFYGIFKRNDPDSDADLGGSSLYASLTPSSAQTKATTNKINGCTSPRFHSLTLGKPNFSFSGLSSPGLMLRSSASIWSSNASVWSENVSFPQEKPNMYADGFAAFHENDLKEIREFKTKLTRLFALLLDFVKDKTTRSFEASPAFLEAELGQLDADLSKMTSSGNLFRGEVSHCHALATSLFQLLRYRVALELRYKAGPANSESLQSQDPPSPPESAIGVLGLKMVEFEISLFILFLPDGTLDDTTGNFNARLKAARRSFSILSQEAERLVQEDRDYAWTFERDLARLREMLEWFETLSRKMNPKGEMPQNTDKEPSVLTENQIETLVSRLEQSDLVLESIMTRLYDTGELDFGYFQERRQEFFSTANKLQESEIPTGFREGFVTVLDALYDKVFCIDTVVACVFKKGCHTQSSEYGRRCLHSSFSSYREKVTLLDAKTKELLIAIGSLKPELSDLEIPGFRASVEDFKFRALALENHDTTEWQDQPDLEKLHFTIHRILLNLEIAEKSLNDTDPADQTQTLAANVTGIEPSKAGILKAVETCDEDSQKVLFLQFSSIRAILLTFLDPNAVDVDTFKEKYIEQRELFKTLLRNARDQNSACLESSRGQIEEISNLIPLLEDVFHRRQHED